MLVYGMILELAAIGGTDYSAALATLLSDTAQLTGSLGKDELMAGLIARQFANATAAGASVPDTLADKMSAIACLQNLPSSPLQLYQIYLLLFCKLGVHKAYVQ